MARERLKEKDRWTLKGLTVKEGSIQNATFITADPGDRTTSLVGGLLTEVSRSFDTVETKPELAKVKTELGPRKKIEFHFGYRLHDK